MYMKNLAYLLLAGSAFAVSCQNSGDQKKGGDIETIKKEAIAIHDEIMPQISTFDKNTVRIDSILTNIAALKAKNAALDTAAARTELSALKSKLEQATGSMEDWMMEYAVDSTNVEYQQKELEKVNTMKKLFTDVSAESKTILGKY
ncbi:transposase [Sphingobacterium spiritivorum]|uniref:Viral A-type inclusion protein n=2 Tax=Sphingobacterium spiritivorum TaxID=258 RepID=D7VMC8_SPHSI|nr:hypothetical protein HMPREF0766_12125 [Sphingobacterium spiritivorum ATCC 33861]QQT34609.1 transposase [Sphingobacterium spiritivorum]